MLGHKDAVKLFKLAEKLDLKLIFVGDPMQHGSVPRGALMRILKDYGGIKPFRLTEIMRQENPDYRAAAKLLSEGKTLEGFDALDAMGWIKEMADAGRPLPAHRRRLPASPRRQEIGAGVSARRTPKPASITAGDPLAAARRPGSWGRRTANSPGWCRSIASEAERGQATTYRPGDVLQFHQNAKGGFTKGDRLTVTDPAAVPLSSSRRNSRSTGRRPSPWPRATRSGSPAR